MLRFDIRVLAQSNLLLEKFVEKTPSSKLKLRFDGNNRQLDLQCVFHYDSKEEVHGALYLVSSPIEEKDAATINRLHRIPVSIVSFNGPLSLTMLNPERDWYESDDMYAAIFGLFEGYIGTSFLVDFSIDSPKNT